MTTPPQVAAAANLTVAHLRMGAHRRRARHVERLGPGGARAVVVGDGQGNRGSCQALGTGTLVQVAIDHLLIFVAG